MRISIIYCARKEWISLSRSKPILVARRQFRHCCVPAEVNGRLQAVVPYSDILKATVIDPDGINTRSAQIAQCLVTGARLTTKLAAPDVEIIRALADNNLNVTETARQLYMHRNTVCHHILRVKKQTGLDPLNFFDLHKLLQQL